MRLHVSIPLLIVLFIATICRAEPADPAILEVLTVKEVSDGTVPAGTQRLEYRSPSDATNDWAMLTPPAGGSRTWAVYLHGHGSGGEQLFARPDVRDSVLAAVRKQGWGALGPNLRGNAWMSPAAASDLRGLIQMLRTRFMANRIVLVGGSMGGTSALAYAVLHPADVDAVIALCPAADIGAFHGWCREQQTKPGSPPVIKELADAIETAYGGSPSTLKDVFAARSAIAHTRESLKVPVFVSHGSADALIPVEQARALAETMRDHTNFMYHELPNAGHDAPIADMDAAMAFVLPRLKP